MHLARSALLLLLPLTAYAEGTYWIDDSCDASKNPLIKKSLKDLLQNAQSQASRANGQLDTNSNDPHVNWLFKAIFAQDISDPVHVDGQPAKDHVHQVMNAINSLVEEDDRLEANVRFYCDQDKRWVKRAGQDGVAEKDVVWDDDLNRMMTMGTPTLQSPDDSALGLAVNYMDMDRIADVEGHVEPRVTITIATRLLGSNAFQPPIYTAQDAAKKDLSLFDINAYNMITTAVIIHELSHCRFIKDTMDFHQNNRIVGYFWRAKWRGLPSGITYLNPVQSLYNADSYAYFATLIALLDQRWRLDGTSSTAGVVSGKMVYDSSLPQPLYTRKVSRAFLA